jgi:hypothetical protein
MRGDTGMTKKTAVWISAILVLLALAASSCSGKRSESPGPAAGNDSEEPAVREPAAAETESGSEPEPARSAGLPASTDWKDAFRFVRDAIRTEPSRYALKTAEGVEWGRSANPLEKALFLAGLLRENGKTVEVARGTLDEAAAKDLLRSIFPPAKPASAKADRIVSQPAENRDLIAAVTRHHWVRMQDGDDWIDLDPSFPAAEPGRAFAALEESLDPTDETLAARVSISVDYEAGVPGGPQSALAWDGVLGDVANRPLSLVISAEFAGADAEEGSATFYNAALTVGGEALADARIDAAKEAVTRIVLKTKVECLGEAVSESERVLFEAAGGSSGPPLFQRHALLITGNRVTAEAWKDGLKSSSDKDLLADVKAGVEEIKRQLAAKTATREILAKSVELEERVGPGLGHLVNMIFASVSDDQAEREGAALSVAHWYAVPRLLITSFSGGQSSTETSFDLRQDKVEAIALPGQAAAMRQAFLYGRGVVESTLEGQLLEVFSGKPALTTAALMREAARNGIPVRMFSAREKSMVDKLGLPKVVAGRISAALDAGRVVVMPEKAVTWEGRKRWGWWDVDPRTMETIGVLDTGLHQAMIQRTILETEGPLDSKMGMVIGAMTGAIDTYWVLSALVLKYGELNKEALLEAKAYMKEIQSVMCPGFEKKASVSVSLTVVDIEDCYKKEIEIFNAEAGVSVSMGWCDSFAKGFACVSTSILNYYLSQIEE